MSADLLPLDGPVEAPPLSHDPPCSGCGHPAHILPCGPLCACVPPPVPGVYP